MNKILVCIVLMPVIVIAGYILDYVATNRAAAKYIPAHHCVVVGFAGDMAQPYYLCDTGLKRKQDMK